MLEAYHKMPTRKPRFGTSTSRSPCLSSYLSHPETHQSAVEDIEKIIRTLSSDDITKLLNSLYEATNDSNKPAVKKEAIRLLFFLCDTQTEFAASYLTKIIGHIVKRLKDSDSGVKDACRESFGRIFSIYLKANATESVASLFVNPLLEALNDQNKGVQDGAAMCMAKMVEIALDPPIWVFHKIILILCKHLNKPNFLAKIALLQVVSSLSQAGAISVISPQCLGSLLESILRCLQNNTDWPTRKAAADALNNLALHSSNLIKERIASTIAALEACRCGNITPAGKSLRKALQQWQGLAGGSEDQKTPTNYDGENSEPVKSDHRKTEDQVKTDEPKTVGSLERFVKDTARNLPLNSRRNGNHSYMIGFEDSGRKYNGYPDYMRSGRGAARRLMLESSDKPNARNRN